MKDKEARRDVSDLWRRVDRADKRIEELKRCLVDDIKVRYCPTCKHETMQQQHENFYMFPPCKPAPCYDWDCLTCGAKIKCETVCKPIKDK